MDASPNAPNIIDDNVLLLITHPTAECHLLKLDLDSGLLQEVPNLGSNKALNK